MTEDSFADHPKSIAEVREERLIAADKFAWGVISPRDALIQMLREIDSGEKITKLVVVAQYDEGNNDTATRTVSVANSLIEAVGLLETGKVNMIAK